MVSKIIENFNVGHIVLGDGWFLKSAKNYNVSHIILVMDGFYLIQMKIEMSVTLYRVTDGF